MRPGEKEEGCPVTLGLGLSFASGIPPWTSGPHHTSAHVACAGLFTWGFLRRNVSGNGSTADECGASSSGSFAPEGRLARLRALDLPAYLYYTHPILGSSRLEVPESLLPVFLRGLLRVLSTPEGIFPGL